jgi:hypothetical protein
VTRDRAVIVAGQVPPEITAPRERAIVANAVRSAFAGGFRVAMLVSAFIALLAAGVGLDRSFSFAARASSR